jgi:DNA-directed RNA polymerase subunit H (RpoH/RPB5)
MSSSNTELTAIYNSRKTLLDIYENTDSFWHLQRSSIAELQNFTMLKSELDYGNIYVKYMMNKSTIRLTTIDDLVEEVFETESILTKKDTLVLIINDEPNDSLIAKMRYLHDNKGYFVVVHNINRLQRNIMKHKLVPQHNIVSDLKVEGEPETMVDKIIAKYNLKSKSQLPEISRFDPIALLICLRPGQICEITRKSPTSITSLYYRVCV